MKSGAWRARLLSAPMNTEELLMESQVAAEDILADLQRILERSRGVIAKMPKAEEIYDSGRELTDMTKALLGAFEGATAMRSELLKALNMPPNTRIRQVARR